MEADPDGPCEAVVRDHLALDLALHASRLVRQYAQRALRSRSRVRVCVCACCTRARSGGRALQQRAQARQVLRVLHHHHFAPSSITITIAIATTTTGGGDMPCDTGQDEKVEEGLWVGVKDGERVARVRKVDGRRERARRDGRVVQFGVGA